MNNKSHILLIDDDEQIRELLTKYLIKNGYLVSSAKDTIDGREALSKFQFDLIILDIMLPGENGVEFAKYLRKISPVAIIMLTALGEIKDRIRGLESGADDYLPKPFEPKELLLRIERILNRSRVHKIDNDYQIKLGDAILDYRTNSFNKNNISIKLSDSELKLLKILYNNKNQIVTRDELSHNLGINSRSVDVQITRLRNKIENDPKKPIHLQSVRNKGYIFYAN